MRAPAAIEIIAVSAPAPACSLGWVEDPFLEVPPALLRSRKPVEDTPGQEGGGEEENRSDHRIERPLEKQSGLP